MLSSTHTEDALHNKRKRIQDQADTEQNNHEDSTASLAKDISIMDMNPSNYVHVRDMIERYKIKKLLHFKKQWEGIEARKKEIEFLEKFLLGKASASSSASSSSSGTFPKKQSSSQEVSTTLSQQQVHDGEGGAKKSDDDYLLSPQKNLQDLLEQQGQDNLIKFNVGGKIFTTTKTTISKRENMLKTMIHSEFGIDRDSSGAIMLDRNPDYFPIILEHLRTGSTTHCGLWEERTEATLPKFKELLEESGFFGTQRLSKAVRIIIGEIEHKIKSKTEPPKSTIVSHTKITDETLDSTMVSTGQEKADQEWIESFMSLTITEKEVADSYFTSLEKKIKEENEMLNSKEREIASFSARTDIVFNVRGVKHTVPLRKIVSHPECILNDFLSALEPPKENQPAQNEIFIDRDPEIFGVILNYLQTGQVNIFNLETHKQKQVYRECKLLNLTGLLDYWNPLRYPIETIGEDNIKMKEEEDYIRHLFATDRENPILNDPYLLLINIFENEKTRTSFRKEDPPAQVPLIFNFENPMEKSELTQKQAIVVPPIPKICANRGQFIAQFNAFTYGIFKDMDWSNIVCAGGSVVAALLDHDKKKESISTEAEDSSMEEQASNWDVDDTCEENPEDNDFELEDDDENVFTDSDDEKSIQTQVFATNPFGLAYVSWGTQQPIETTADKELAHTYTYSVWSKSDVDLFIYGLSEKEAEEKINYLFTLFKTNLNGHVYRKYFMSTGQGYNTQLQDDILVVRTEHSVTFYFQYPIRPIQIILRIYKSITEVLCGFDCDSVTFGFDGSQVFCLPRGRRAINTRSNLVDPSRQSKTYEIRLLKYAKRGFRIAIPGYDETKIKNEILLAGKTAYTPIRRRRYRYYMTQTTPRADVRAMTGLARLLVIKQATKFSRNVDKAVNGKYLEDEEMNVHDYKQLSLPYNSLTTAAMNYLTTKRVVEFFKEKLDKKPHFEFALNDVTSVLHASGDNSTISPDVKWITVEPGRQYIGSFHPSTTNFYKDAYTSQLAKKPVVIAKKKKVRVTWHWQHKANYNEYDKSTSALIEKAYQKFKKNKSDHTVVISNTHFIDFNQNKQIALDDRSRMRHVKRTKVKLPNQ